MSVILAGTSGNLVTVDSDGHLYARTGSTATTAGFATLMGEMDSGSTSGERRNLAAECNEDFNLRVGSDNMLFYETFNGTVQNFNKWRYVSSTMTVTQANGFVTLNSGASITSGTFIYYYANSTFRYIGTQTLMYQCRAKISNALTLGKVADMGIGWGNTTAQAGIPQDGIWFRWDVDGTLRGVIDFGGASTVVEEYKSDYIIPPTDDTVHLYGIEITWDDVSFWIDGVERARIRTPKGQGQPSRTMNGQIFNRVANIFTVPNAFKFNISHISVNLGSLSQYRPWADNASGRYLNCNAGVDSTWPTPNGASAQTTTSGSQTNWWVTGTTAGAATLSNTATPSGGYPGGALGGFFKFNAVNGATTDYVAYNYTVPAGSVSLEARNLRITDITITTNSAGAAFNGTSGTVIQWCLGLGCFTQWGTSGVDLTTADASNAKAPRRVPIGMQGFAGGGTSGVGAEVVTRSFKTPLLVEAGTTLHVIARVPYGVATASQYFRGIVSINGYWE